MKHMAQRKTRTTTRKPDVQGLSIRGMIVDRSRRMVPLDNPTTEIVTYTIQDAFNHRYFVDDFAPNEYHDLNANVCIPVYIKAYNRRNGTPSYTLNVQKEELSRGERF